MTEPDRTARWFGRWNGAPVVGGAVTVVMGFEEGAPTMEMRIEACEPPPPSFDDYYPAQKAYYERQAEELLRR